MEALGVLFLVLAVWAVLWLVRDYCRSG